MKIIIKQFIILFFSQICWKISDYQFQGIQLNKEQNQHLWRHVGWLWMLLQSLIVWFLHPLLQRTFLFQQGVMTMGSNAPTDRSRLLDLLFGPQCLWTVCESRKVSGVCGWCDAWLCLYTVQSSLALVAPTKQPFKIIHLFLQLPAGQHTQTTSIHSHIYTYGIFPSSSGRGEKAGIPGENSCRHGTNMRARRRNIPSPPGPSNSELTGTSADRCTTSLNP